MPFSLRIQRFCFCCPLRKGTLIIGVLGLILNLVKIFVTPTYNGDKKVPWEVSQGGLLSRVTIGLLSLIATSLLIVGVYKRNKKFLLPWLIVEFIGCIFLVVLCIFCFGALFVIPEHHVGALISIGIILFLLNVLSWYCWLCVWSYYMELPNRGIPGASSVQYQTPENDVSPPDSDALI